MTLNHRETMLSFLPVLFFGFGILSAGVATRTAILIAPEPQTLLDAVAGGNDEAMFRMMSEGDDPGRPGVLKRPVLHWEHGDTVSPAPGRDWRGRHQQGCLYGEAYSADR